jgi:rubrerythrin
MNPIIDMLKHALQAERDGFYHYSNAAHRTGDPKAKEIFDNLAQDELAHHKMLEATLASVEKGGAVPAFSDADRGTWGTLSGPSPIFSEDFQKRIRDPHFEMSALSIGMALEQNGINFYAEMERKAEHPEVKKMCRFLVQWEQSHLEALSAQLKMFHETSWADAGFSPF